MTNTTATPAPVATDDCLYDVADRLVLALEAAAPAGLTPSQAARQARCTYREAADTLAWMVDEQYAHTSGNGAWTHYHAGSAQRSAP